MKKSNYLSSEIIQRKLFKSQNNKLQKKTMKIIICKVI